MPIEEYKCEYPQTTIIESLFLLLIFSLVVFAILSTIVTSLLYISKVIFGGIISPLEPYYSPPILDEIIPFVEIGALPDFITIVAMIFYSSVLIYMANFAFTRKMLEVKEIYKTQSITWTLSSFRKSISHFILGDFLVLVSSVVLGFGTMGMISYYGNFVNYPVALGIVTLLITVSFTLLISAMILEFRKNYLIRYFELIGGYENGEDGLRLHTNKVTLLHEGNTNISN